MTMKDLGLEKIDLYLGAFFPFIELHGLNR